MKYKCTLLQTTSWLSNEFSRSYKTKTAKEAAELFIREFDDLETQGDWSIVNGDTAFVEVKSKDNIVFFAVDGKSVFVYKAKEITRKEAQNARKQWS